MLRSCPYCGRIHPAGYICKASKRKRAYNGGEERKLRSTYAWTKKSKEIREKAQGLCEVCRDKGLYTYTGLEVHHIEKVREDKDRLLDNYNLICVCAECHKQAEQGKIDKEYLRKLARKREQG
jgi:5-methylcytosine-specific restriction protein A